MFNALKYSQELEKSGFTREQAEASVRLLIEVMNDEFATKSDFRELGMKLDQMSLALNQKLDSSIRESEYKMTIKLGTMMTIAIGLTATVTKILQTI